MGEDTVGDPVESQYGLGGLGARILEALKQAGADLDALTPEDLAPVDAFHVRGREASEELARIVEDTGPVDRVLDVGSGIGGACRFLARRLDCEVTGVDVTREYCELAAALSERVGLAGRTTFRQASALDLPFPDGTFDLVWTEHVQMNISDKTGFYREAARVLKPGGHLAFHDIVAGSRSPIHFPVPWADHAGISFLIDPGDLRRLLDAAGLQPTHWEDTTEASSRFFEGVLEGLDRHGPRPVGTHLLMGASAGPKLRNMARNLVEDRIRVLMVVLEKQGG